jgi:hypothetical protein
MSDVYVDNVLGDDTTGTGAIGAPYKTIGKGASSGGGLTAGDTLYIKDNPANPYLLVTDESSEIEIQVSGTSGNPISIRPWDDGDTVVIDTEDPVTTKVFDLNSNDYLDFYDIEVDGSNQSANQISSVFDINECSYINFYRINCHDLDLVTACMNATTTGQTPPANNILFDKCRMADIADSVPTATAACIAMGGCNVNYWTIRGCTFDGAIDEGVKTQWQDASADINNIIIDRCNFLNVTGEDVNLKQTRDWIIRDCYFGPAANGAVDLNGAWNGLIERCKIFNIQGNGIRTLGGTFGGKTFRNGNIEIRDCEIIGCGTSAGSGNPRGIDFAWLTDDYGDAAKIYNCTIKGTLQYAGSGGDAIRVRCDFLAGNSEGDPTVRIKNCIITDNADDGIHLEGDDPTPGLTPTVTIDNDYNCYNNNTGSNIDSAPQTFWTVNDPETNGLTQDTDPKYRDAANNKYELAPSSPCIGAGDPAIPSEKGSAPDIGGIEYGAPVTRPVGTSGRPARMRHGKYYKGHSEITGELELARMEK